MRWLVEVSSLGKTDLQKFCVEAESWQRALQAARTQRGEEGPMSGFSIELLEDGYRAVDPVARIRFVVKRAPDGMAVTTIAIDSLTGMTNPPSSAGATTEPWLAPAASSSTVAAVSVSPSNGQAGAEKIVVENGATLTHDAAGMRAKSSTMVFASPGAAEISEANAIIREKQALPERGSSPAIGSSIPGLPNVKLVSSREQNATEAAPMTYREYAFAVPEGTSEETAGEVLRAQLRLVEAHIGAAKGGKLVNLAVFDIEFTGKPPRAPLATLTWKDWKGEPVLAFPRRAGASKPPPASQPPPPVAQPAEEATASKPVASQEPAVSKPATSQEPAVSKPATSAPAATSSAAAPHEAVASKALAPEATKPAASQLPATESTASSSARAPSVPPPAAPAAKAIEAAPPASAKAPSNAPPAKSPSGAPPAKTPSGAPSSREPESRRSSAALRTASGHPDRGRVSGDELITSLFESMHDLHFLRDALDGGQFCLQLATEVLPASGALIHFFDIEKRDWLIACARGRDVLRLLATRTPENDEILRDAARRRRAVVVASATNATGERYRQLGGARSLIIAPILQAGRVLGAIEIINPLDGNPFNEDEGHAMTYIAEQYAEYIGSRGIVLDRDRIHAAGAAAARG